MYIYIYIYIYTLRRPRCGELLYIISTEHTESICFPVLIAHCVHGAWERSTFEFQTDSLLGFRTSSSENVAVKGITYFLLCHWIARPHRAI